LGGSIPWGNLFWGYPGNLGEPLVPHFGILGPWGFVGENANGERPWGNGDNFSPKMTPFFLKFWSARHKNWEFSSRGRGKSSPSASFKKILNFFLPPKALFGKNFPGRCFPPRGGGIPCETSLGELTSPRKRGDYSKKGAPVR